MSICSEEIPVCWLLMGCVQDWTNKMEEQEFLKILVPKTLRSLLGHKQSRDYPAPTDRCALGTALPCVFRGAVPWAIRNPLCLQPCSFSHVFMDKLFNLIFHIWKLQIRVPTSQSSLWLNWVEFVWRLRAQKALNLIAHRSLCLGLDPPAIANCSPFPGHTLLLYFCMFLHVLFPLPGLPVSIWSLGGNHYFFKTQHRHRFTH